MIAFSTHSKKCVIKLSKNASKFPCLYNHFRANLQFNASCLIISMPRYEFNATKECKSLCYISLSTRLICITNKTTMHESIFTSHWPRKMPSLTVFNKIKYYIYIKLNLMGELDSLHCIFLMALLESLDQSHLFKRNRNYKSSKILEQKLFSLVKNISSKLESSNLINLNKTTSNLN